MALNTQDKLIYEEKISSNRTEALFVLLATFFLLLMVWRVNSSGWNFLSIVFLLFLVIFLFYSLNYRTLTIRLTPDALKLTFGIFTWTIPIGNIESCNLDNPPPVKKFGGAGIHFMFVDDRYRASFNFLEYPRVVIALRKKGMVRDISFSTRRPDEVLRLLREATTAHASA
jgi:energy-coupling factor transporter transmembrane protein EcfT